MTEEQVVTPPETISDVFSQDTQNSDSNELVTDAPFDEASVFGGFDRVNTAPEEPVENTTAPQEEVKTETSEPNEQVRYEYWQSEADKARNELNEVKQQLAQVEQSQNLQAQTAKEEESYDYFPPPPTKPNKPSVFNREDALADPSSESAKYLDSVDSWRDEMDEYNRLYTEYNMALMTEEKQKFQEEQAEIQRKQAEQEQYSNNMSEMQSYLSKKYQASPEEMEQFVKVMDAPESLSVDNLFQLFRMQNGNNQPQEQQQIVTAQSSTNQNESFDQLKRAQQVPSPMGVLPSSNMNTSATPEDSLMDSMVNDYKNRNPWNI